jgi:hypothetical protein
VLRNLLYEAKIGRRSERILSIIGEYHPERVLDFFVDRINFATNPEAGEKYEAVPFHLSYIQQSLSRIPGYIVPRVQQVLSEGDPSIQFECGHLLSSIFLDLLENLEIELLAIVSSGDLDGIKFVVDILRNFQESRPCGVFVERSF